MFDTERLVVRQWRQSDRERVLDIYSRWEVARWLGSAPAALADLAAAEARIERWRGLSDDPRFGLWALEHKETGVALGSVLLLPLAGGAGEVEVGWHLHPDSWGHGYATEAARAVLAHGFAAGLPEVFAVVRPGNGPSMAVCRRLGMTHQGLTDRWYGLELECFRLGAPPAA
ncbi:GNAT family N-acetyltransferase [Kitasatospora sp. NPDC006697]|uniref:GNAT family N-acetyltransferase n=1 Tax=Kitasatospora sp. NPDC006697 TaxID=3364020 RepID=UPI0036A69E9F